MPPPVGYGALSDDARLTSDDVCLSRTSGLSREQRPKNKIGKEAAHVTRDSDTHFQGQKIEGQLAGAGHIVAVSRTARYATAPTGRRHAMMRVLTSVCRVHPA